MSNEYTADDYRSEEEEEELWEKPAWTKAKLRKTGLAETMKKEGNLAAPVTFTPFKNEDHSNRLANPNILNKTELGEKMKKDGNLANPITNIREARIWKKNQMSAQ